MRDYKINFRKYKPVKNLISNHRVGLLKKVLNKVSKTHQTSHR